MTEEVSSLAFLDIGPISEGHTQVIPKRMSFFAQKSTVESEGYLRSIYTGHVRTLLDMTDEDLADIGPVVKKVAQMTGAEQYNILQVRFNYITLVGSLHLFHSAEQRQAGLPGAHFSPNIKYPKKFISHIAC